MIPMFGCGGVFHPDLAGICVFLSAIDIVLVCTLLFYFVPSKLQSFMIVSDLFVCFYPTFVIVS